MRISYLRLLALVILATLSCPETGYGQEHEQVQAEQAPTDSTHLQILKTRQGATLIGRTTALRSTELDFTTKY